MSTIRPLDASSNFTKYLSPNFIDFRIQLGPTAFNYSEGTIDTARVIYGFHVAEVAILPFIWLLGFYLLYEKMIKLRVVPWMIVDGAVVPRGPELWILCSSLFNFFQWIYSILLVTDSFTSYTAREAFFESKWGIAFLGATHYLFSLIHATPKSPTSYRNTPTGRSTEKFLPTNVILNISYLLLASLIFIPLGLAIATGVAADNGDDAGAEYFVKAHYFAWSICVWVYTFVLFFWAWKLIGLLQENMRVQEGGTKSDVEGGVVTAKSLEGGAVGRSPTSVGGKSTTSAAPKASAQRMRKAIMTMLVTIGGISGITSMFGVLLMAYAYQRTPMHEIAGSLLS
ncbi:hypothetical protein HDV05_006404 [Chytridiales sp. JEL 0842]|nr:hypothetical protein HDV05_006404 [Chytridiales sp. JEL 0842]